LLPWYQGEQILLSLLQQRLNVAIFCVAEIAQYFNKNVTSGFSTCYGF